MKRIESLDALRAVAALSVFFYHIRELANARLGDFLWFGWIGVDLFFVLSGFFIGIAVMAPQEWKPRSFLQRRIRRIVPAFYVSLFVIIFLINSYILVQSAGWEVLLHHLLMVHTLFKDSSGAINGVYWTLGVEFYFYLLMLLSAPLLRSKWRWLLLSIWFVVCYGWRFWVIRYGPDNAFDRFFIASQLPGMLDLFAIGIVLAWVATRRNWLERASLHYRWAAPLFLIAGSALFTLCLLQLETFSGFFWFHNYAVIGWRTLLGLSFALLIIALILLNESGIFRTGLKVTGIAYLGKISYSIYLYHIPIIVSLHRAEVPGFPTTNWKMAFMMGVMTLLVAMVSYHLVEEPFYRKQPA